MSKMLKLSNCLLRICPSNSQKLEYSTNDGSSWHSRYRASSSQGDFQDLVDNSKEILATTSKGLYYSTNEGNSWHRR